MSLAGLDGAGRRQRRRPVIQKGCSVEQPVETCAKVQDSEGDVKLFLATLYVFALTLAPTVTKHPGIEGYTPTRTEWLSVRAQADLREDYTKERGFSLAVAKSGRRQ
jgi:hypothetical protein